MEVKWNIQYKNTARCDMKCKWLSMIWNDDWNSEVTDFHLTFLCMSLNVARCNLTSNIRLRFTCLRIGTTQLLSIDTTYICCWVQTQFLLWLVRDHETSCFFFQTWDAPGLVVFCCTNNIGSWALSSINTKSQMTRSNKTIAEDCGVSWFWLNHADVLCWW